MKRFGGSAVRLLTGSMLLFAVTGCSFIFVTPPSTPSDEVVERPGKCTSSALAPGLDSVFGGLEVVRTVLAATADESVYSEPNQPLSREADVGLGVGFTALFLSSAIYGFYYTSRCSDLRNGNGEHYGDSNWSSRHAPPAARTTIKRSRADDETAPTPDEPGAPELAPGTEDSAKGEPKPEKPERPSHWGTPDSE